MPTASKSNDYHLVQIDSIIVGDRFRKDYGDINDLAASIQQYGLLHPIVVSREGQLLAGGRRLSAAKLLAWTEIPVHFIDEVDGLLVREIELEENLLREDLDIWEEALLTREIHRIKTELNGSATPTHPGEPNAGWSLRKTADVIPGGTLGTVQRNIQLANLLDVMPSIRKETSQVNALRARDRLVSDLENEQDRRQRNREAYAKLESSVICGDAITLIESLADHSIDCIITDPPYGVDVGKGGGHRVEADFDDDPATAMALLRAISVPLARVLKPSGHFYCFFATIYWEQVRGIMSKAGFDVRDIPCIWTKPGGATGTGDWDHNFAASWEPFLFASNRQRRLNFKRKNVFTYAVDLGNARVHPTQKPVELLRELVQLSTEPNELVLDPFAGSGSTLVAASQLRRRFIGFEQNPHYHSVSLKRLVDEGKERPYVPKPEV